MKLIIKNKEYDVKIVTSKEDKEKGLQGVKSLSPNEGMLFVFDEPQTVEFWMKDTLIDLDIIFIDEDQEVIDMVKGEAGNDEDVFEEDEVKYVLELNTGHRFRPGTEVEFDLDEEDNEDENNSENLKLHVLDSNGNTQMILTGGERIFSRKNTKTIVKLSKKALEDKSESSFKKLGRKVFQYLDIQENNDPDYVEPPK